MFQLFFEGDLKSISIYILTQDFILQPGKVHK